MSNLLFYDNPVALNKVEHKDTKIMPLVNSFKFAAKTNSVIVAGVEFTEAAKEYTIVFTRSGEHIIPVALLGLRNEENLFVGEDGNWDGKYIPAFVRRYPFAFAETGTEGQRVVCLDDSYEGFSKEEGEPLFDGEEATPILQQALDFLDEYQKQYQRTEQFVARLEENDLLMNLDAKIDMNDGAQFSLTGLLAIDEKKLLQLSDEKAMELFRSGELAWVYIHLMSLSSMGQLVQRIGRKTGASGEKLNPDDKAANKKAAKKKKD